MTTDDRTAADDRYLAAWNIYQAAWGDISDGDRQAMLDESVAPNCVYTDPTSINHGYRELTAKMQNTQLDFPGATFRNDRFASHHGQAVSHWTMFDGEGTAIFTGTSYARYTDDFRVDQMIGFFDPVR